MGVNVCGVRIEVELSAQTREDRPRKLRQRRGKGDLQPCARIGSFHPQPASDLTKNHRARIKCALVVHELHARHGATEQILEQLAPCERWTVSEAKFEGVTLAGV